MISIVFVCSVQFAHRGQQMQQSVSRQRSHSQTDAELDAELEHLRTGREQQHHDPKHGHQTDDEVGQGGVSVSWAQRTHSVTVYESTHSQSRIKEIFVLENIVRIF